MTEAGLRAQVVVQRPNFTLDVTLEIPAGGTLVVTGENGSGKSTLLGALAGLLAVDSGSIIQGGRVLDDAASDRFVPPRDRGAAVLLQGGVLFPHLDARDNVAFGLRARGASRRAARSHADGALQSVGLADRTSARPRELSGGQAQRVALARTLVLTDGARLLLLDEPLAGLDPETRSSMLALLREHIGRFSGVAMIVTHDPSDATALAAARLELRAGQRA